MLRTAKTFRLLGREHRRHCAVRPGQSPFGWLIGWPPQQIAVPRFIPGPADREQPALTLHHDVSSIRCRRRNQPDAPGAGPHLLPHPFGAGPRLAKTAAGEDQPVLPVTFRSDLVFAGKEAPVVKQRLAFIVSEACQRCPYLFGRQAGDR